MSRPEPNEEMEDLITSEIIVDCYGGYEQAAGWYCYLEDRLAFPFEADVITRERTSPLKAGNSVTVTGMAPQEECDHRMRVTVVLDDGEIDVPLAQIRPVDSVEDDDTHCAIQAWHYWVSRGYEF